MSKPMFHMLFGALAQQLSVYHANRKEPYWRSILETSVRGMELGKDSDFTFQLFLCIIRRECAVLRSAGV